MERGFIETLEKYGMLLNEKKEIEEKLKKTKSKIEELKEALSEQMIAEEIPKITKDGYSYTLTQKTQYSKKAGVDEELFELLRQYGLGDVIKETVAPRTLQSTIKNLVDEFDGVLPSDLGGLLHVYEYFDILRRKN